MIRPKSFGFNSETALNNAFQQETKSADINNLAVNEFDNMVSLLRESKIEVHVVDDTDFPVKPDAIFPNNWISFGHDGIVRVYSMFAENRRNEVRQDIIEEIGSLYKITRVINYADKAGQNVFLEGTGSIVFDHDNKLAFASESERTHYELLCEVCESMEYTPVFFPAFDKALKPIYHTNVIMTIGKNYCIICAEAIPKSYRESVMNEIRKTNKKVIEISLNQVYTFAGNALEVLNRSGSLITVLSRTAFDSLSSCQLANMESVTNLLPVSIPTIEKVGGGSVRCMMAEIFSERR
ncbi:MAG: citrulline utilization hydrolase CtlX [Flavobacteriales bacterium]